MNIRHAVAAIVLVSGLTTAGWAQVRRTPDLRKPDSSRFKRGRSPRVSRRRPTSRRAPSASKRQALFSEANAIASKLYKSGPWSQHAQVIQQSIESLYAQNNWNTEQDQFGKRMSLEVSKRPPWDFNGRMKIASDMIKDRYGLNDDQVKKLRSKFIQNSFQFFMENAETLLPVVREALDTRLANKPFTPEQVAKWAKVVRPVAERWYARAGQEITRFSKDHLTPEQQAKVREDLAIVGKRAEAAYGALRSMEKGEWTPRMSGLANDPVHVAMQARLDAGRPPTESANARPAPPPPPTPKPPAARPPGPMRIGEKRPTAKAMPAREESSLPDETAWVNYVRQFCVRYGLDKAQQASAYAILQDLQEQAQAYRGSRGDEIKRLEAQVRDAGSPELRRDASAELRQVLVGIDELFKELKTRLNSIPTVEQLRRGG